MIKLLSLFSGIGAFEKALTNIGEPYEIVNYCEIDKYASKSYSLIHNLDENMNLKDVTTIETAKLPHDIDFITYGFPCQDISNAGKQKGFTDENGDLTRSGLFFEALRIIEDTQPKIAIAENVKALTGKRFTAEFKIVLDSLNDAGYTNYWAVLNAKDYGIPQNRERVFIISIRNDINHGYNFPKKYELKLRLKDLLETDVDEKYYLSDKALEGLIKHAERNKQNGNGFGAKFIDENDIAFSITTNPTHTNSNFLKVKNGTKKGYQEAHAGDYVNLQFPDSDIRRGRVGVGISQTLCCNDQNGVVVDKLFNIYGENKGTGFAGNVYNPDGLAPTLRSASGGNQQPLICTVIVKNQAREITKQTDVASCLMARDYKGFGNQEMNAVIEYDNNLWIHRLTPKECFRLMGFSDCDIDILIDNGISNTQLYKMAGNSIVVDVLEEIFVELLNQYENVFPVGE